MLHGAHAPPFCSTYSGNWVDGHRKGYGTQRYEQVSRCKWKRGTYTGEWEVFDDGSYYHGRASPRAFSLPSPAKPRAVLNPHSPPNCWGASLLRAKRCSAKG